MQPLRHKKNIENATPSPINAPPNRLGHQNCDPCVKNTSKIKNSQSENKLSFFYDSDAFISKGMITILCDIYGDRNPSEIKKSDFSLLNVLKLDTLLTPGRRNGVYSMLEKIKDYAITFQNKEKI